MKQTKLHIYGKHAVVEALENTPKIIKKIYLASTMDDKGIRALVLKSGIPTERLDPRKVSSQVERNAPHQGIVALISGSDLEVSFDDFSETFEAKPDTLLVLLHGLQDPHNVGAIIRSAVAFGATAILMPEKGQASLSAALIKTSAGMAFRLPLVTVHSIPQALTELKAKGVRIYGFAGESEHSLSDEMFRAPSLLIFGNEGAGIPKETRKLTDLMLSIPMSKRAESLNVAASAAVALYAWSARHVKAVKS